MGRDEEEGKVALLLGSAPQKARETIPAPYGSKQDEERGTRIETRVHQRQCVQCTRWFWAWDPARFRCFVCDAPPPGELRRILEVIHGTKGSVDRRGANGSAAPAATGEIR
jgi:hypothetical protein